MAAQQQSQQQSQQQQQMPPLPPIGSAMSAPPGGIPKMGFDYQAPLPPPARPLPPPLDTMRAYRACLNCRNRKSKCDLDINGGRPPCRRCQREDRPCVLGESHRGGRRVRKKPKLDQDGAPSSNAGTPSPSHSSAANQAPTSGSPATSNMSQYNQFAPQQTSSFQNGFWQQPTPTSSVSANAQAGAPGEYRGRLDSTASLLGPLKPGLREGIASADLQNPSDALEILARVADRADDASMSNLTPPNGDDTIMYGPCQAGQISQEIICSLFSLYEENFHPFFPIIPRQTFDRTRLPWLSRHEPHLFSAILTIASKHSEDIHQVCYEHMQGLILHILAGADANVEAVEAMLLLSQWVSHRPQVAAAVGRGEEDRVAWMYIGTALRLAYFLGIDRTAFKSDAIEDPALFHRKRLVWSACYICDRQVSVRVGRGFWARGPGPLSGLRSNDFPTLQPLAQGDNYALIFQANLELTQIFSNVHDILYSSKGHGWKEMLEGRYAKYLDDFRASIHSWDDNWSKLECSPRLKSSLVLTYDYLRLYVNAFAYQATISRAVTFQRDSQHDPNRPMPLINASAPDARFIYEALNAAKSLLSNFGKYVDPETLRYMPATYYLFTIYSAVFLYKARSTTTMTDEERIDVRRMIYVTIERLQQASAGPNHMGSRYARLLHLLWRKSPSLKRPPPDNNNSGMADTHDKAIDPRLQQAMGPTTANPGMPQMPGSFDPNSYLNGPALTAGMNGGQAPGAFSWLDLGATWNFATQNNSVSGGSAGELDDVLIDPGLSPFDMNLLTDYSMIEGDGGGLIF